MARGEGKRWRRWLLLPLAAVLGAAVVVLPAIASSEGATVEAKSGSGEGGVYEWSPASAGASSGGQITIKNPSASVYHGVEWTSGPENATPSCSAGVPVGAAAIKWEGTCTFVKPGTYTFRCTVHSYMTETVTVSPGGGTTGTSTGSTSTGTPNPPPTSGGTTATPPSGGEAGSSEGGSSAPASLAKAVKLAGSQHGHAVHGSVTIAPGSAGARLEVDLLASSVGLASAGHTRQVRVGTFVVAHVHSGAVSFSVGLSSRARNALRRRKHLTVTVRITLQTPGGSRLVTSRSVTLHA
jgi:plastocyanin